MTLLGALVVIFGQVVLPLVLIGVAWLLAVGVRGEAWGWWRIVLLVSLLLLSIWFWLLELEAYSSFGPKGLALWGVSLIGYILSTAKLTRSGNSWWLAGVVVLVFLLMYGAEVLLPYPHRW